MHTANIPKQPCRLFVVSVFFLNDFLQALPEPLCAVPELFPVHAHDIIKLLQRAGLRQHHPQIHGRKTPVFRRIFLLSQYLLDLLLDFLHLINGKQAVYEGDPQGILNIFTVQAIPHVGLQKDIVDLFQIHGKRHAQRDIDLPGGWHGTFQPRADGLSRYRHIANRILTLFLHPVKNFSGQGGVAVIKLIHFLFQKL